MNTLVLDIESYYDAHTSVGRGKMTYVEYSRAPDFELFGASVKWNNEEPKWLRPGPLFKYLQELPANYTLVGHNLPFDGCCLGESGFPLKARRYFCTRAAAQAIYNSSITSASLDALAKQFLKDEKTPGVLDSVKGKHWCDMTSLEQKAMEIYCNHDVYLTDLLYKLFEPQLPAEEQLTLHHTQRMYLEPLLIVDQDILHQTIADAVSRRDQLIEKAGEILKTDGKKTLTLLSGDTFSKRLAKYTEIPMKPSPSVEGRFIPALAKADLEMQALVKSSVPEIRTLCEARLNVKSNILKTRAERFLRDDVPYSRFYLNYAGAIATLRDSGGQRSNKQNLPRGSTLRASIQAPKGYKLMVIDSSNIELRTMFYIAGQEDKLTLIRAGEDQYSHSAADTIYHIPVEDITKKQRAVGKVQMLSLQYGASWKKMKYIFAAGLMGPPVDLTDAEAEAIWNNYRAHNRKVKNFWFLCDGFLHDMAQGIIKTYNIPGTTTPLYTTEKDKLYSHSCGLYLHFKDLEYGPSGWTYQSRTARAKIYGAMLTGRLNQHYARNIVFHQINQIAEHYPLVLRVHDEGGFLIPDDPEEIAHAEQLALEAFATAPDFAPGLPCSGEVVTATPYEKP